MMTAMDQPASRLSRRLGTADVVVIGVGAMIGTGVFVVWAPAADRAGQWLLAGLAIAAFVAFCNATSSAQLAAVHPQSGGTYVYGRERLGIGWGALAGYAFLGGKLASCAAAALAVGVYLWPDQQRLVAVAAVLAVTAVNLAGVHQTARFTRILISAVIAVLVTLVVTGVASGARASVPIAEVSGDVSVLDVLGAAAVLFFAFAGYARIATLGEEVKDPAQTIPRAVPLALGIVLVIYVAIGATVLLVLGPTDAASRERPLAAVADATGASWLEPIVAITGGVAALAVLVALVAGIARTTFAMASDGELPRFLGKVHPTRRVPHVAETAVAAVVIVAVLTGGLVAAVTFSAFAVLLYYAIANAAALRLHPSERRWPKALAASGLVACLVLAASLPWQTVVLGSSGLVVAMAARALVRRIRRARHPR
jgi:basic amino acid/polyamine antiporter, APA family